MKLDGVPRWRPGESLLALPRVIRSTTGVDLSASTPPSAPQLPTKASTAAVELVAELRSLASRKTSSSEAMALRIDFLIRAQVNARLELLAQAILCHIGFEDTLPVRAAISRGLGQQVVLELSAAARKDFAQMARDMKVTAEDDGGE